MGKGKGSGAEARGGRGGAVPAAMMGGSAVFPRFVFHRGVTGTGR